MRILPAPDWFTVSNAGVATLGTSGAGGLTGQLAFATTTNTNKVTLQSATQRGNYTLDIPALAGNATICTSNSTTACGNFIQNQNAAQQATSNFWISGTGRADTSILTPLVDTATAVALNIGTTNATQINLNENTVVANDKSIVIGSTAGIGNATALQVNYGTTQIFTVDSSAGNNRVTVGSPGDCLNQGGKF